MRMDKLTHSLQAVLGSAQSLAVGYAHAFIEPTHVLQAMLAETGSPTRHILLAAGAFKNITCHLCSHKANSVMRYESAMQ